MQSDPRDGGNSHCQQEETERIWQAKKWHGGCKKVETAREKVNAQYRIGVTMDRNDFVHGRILAYILRSFMRHLPYR